MEKAYSDVLMVSPNLNPASIYAVKMIPSTGFFEVNEATDTATLVDM